MLLLVAVNDPKTWLWRSCLHLRWKRQGSQWSSEIHGNSSTVLYHWILLICGLVYHIQSLYGSQAKCETSNKINTGIPINSDWAADCDWKPLKYFFPTVQISLQAIVQPCTGHKRHFAHPVLCHLNAGYLIRTNELEQSEISNLEEKLWIMFTQIIIPAHEKHY